MRHGNVWLNSPELAHKRVLIRVARGGHDVPEKVIRRRYERSQNNLIPYLKSCDEVFVFDNSGETPLYVGHGAKNIFISDGHSLGAYILNRMMNE